MYVALCPVPPKILSSSAKKDEYWTTRREPDGNNNEKRRTLDKDEQPRLDSKDQVGFNDRER